MVRRAYLVVGIAAAALVMTLVVASISTGSVLGVQRPPGREGNPGSGSLHRPHLPGPGEPSIPHWLIVSVTVLLLLYALGVVLLVVLGRGSRRATAPRLILDEDELDQGSAWGAVITAELGRAAAEQLDALTHGTPRNAIVACWLRLQSATQQAGLPAAAWETSHEYTVRALRRLSLDGSAITTLSELYREARFSDHEMTEEQRGQAVAALSVLAAQLARQSADTPVGRTGQTGSALDSVAR